MEYLPLIDKAASISTTANLGTNSVSKHHNHSMAICIIQTNRTWLAVSQHDLRGKSTVPNHIIRPLNGQAAAQAQYEWNIRTTKQHKQNNNTHKTKYAHICKK